MKVQRYLEKLSSALLIASMILGLFASPVISTGAVVKAQDLEPTAIPTEVVVEPTTVPEQPTAVPEEPTAVPEEPTQVPEEPTAVPEVPTLEPTLEPTVEVTVEPTQTPVGLETASPTPTATPTITATPTATELPLVVPVFEAQGDSAIPDQYIVVYKDSPIFKAASTEGDSISIMSADVSSVESLGGDVKFTYTAALKGFAASLSPEALIKLRQNPDIDYIEQDRIVSISDDIEVNSIQDNATWGLDRIDQASGVDGKYTYFYNGTGVHVYVIDTGILPTHPEFGGRANKVFDAFDDSNRLDDCNGHGTHVAGTIGGTTYGVVKNTIIHAVRVLNCGGTGTTSQVLAGINWVTANHMSPAVANMSLGGAASTAENQAVAGAIASGVTFVVAAGNDSYDACYYSPASLPAAITVGATDLTDSPSSFSNYGSCLDIYAPGTNITSAWYTGGYNTINGTSMASPHVAGAVALLLQANPSASPATITSLLLGNAVNGVLNNIGNGSPNKMLFTKPLPNPTAPVLLSPVVGANLKTTDPVLTWKTVTGASLYRVQVSDSIDFISTSYDTDSSDLFFEATGLPDGLYYWRVMSKNPVGIESPWSDPFTFIIDTTGPAAPSLTSPENGSTVVGTPNFAWTVVSDATGYMIEIDSDNGFNLPVVYSNPASTDGVALTSTSIKPSTLTAGATYYWHVRSRDAAGNWGDWGISRSLVVEAPITQSPSLLAPVSGVTVSAATPLLTWTAVDYGVNYQVQISSDSTFLAADFENVEKGAGVLSHTAAAGMVDGIKYYWRVRALNPSHAAGPWSEIRYFTLDTTAPAAPVLSSPAAFTTVIGIPTFVWSAPATATAYQFQYSIDGFITDPTFSTPTDTPITVTSYKPAVLPTGIVYTWRVRARDAYGNWGIWSDTRWVNVQASLPVAPVVTAPLVGLITNNTTPDFAWNAVAGAMTYEIQIDNLSTFASPEVSDSSAATTYTSSSPITPDGVYYYRVRAVNATGGAGVWSAARSFTMDTVAPGEPPLTSPLHATTPVGTPTFIWAAISDANAYQFQYSVYINFSSIDYSSPGPGYPGTVLAAASHKPTVNMTPGIPYYWHVRARDIAGNWGEWGYSRIITVQAALPGVPVVTAPAIGVITNNATPSITWNAMADAASFDVQIDNLSTFASPEAVGSVATNTFVPSSALPADGIYYYRIRAINVTGGAGSWSAARSFTLDTVAPAAPVLSSPLDAATPVGTPTFIWAAASGANAYQYQYSADNSFAIIDYSTPGDTFPGTPLTLSSHKPTINMTPGTPYYWRSRARDLAGNWGAWSPTWSIIPQAALPGVPVVTAPAIGLLTNIATPAFTWNVMGDAASFDVQIDNLSTFTSPEAVGNVATNSYVPSSALPADGIYYYRIRAINATGGAGSWSAVRSFTLDTIAPAAPVMYSPLDADTPVGTPSFVWIACTGANAYQFQYSADNSFGTVDYSTPGDTVPGTPLVVTTHKPTVNMTVGIPYYWHARARDAAGNWGAWTTARSVIIQASLPGVPVVTAPVAGLLTNDSTPTLSWNTVASAATYDVQIDNQATFSSLEVSSNTSSITYTPPTPLPSDGVYYYRIRAINATNGFGTWSTARSFTLDTIGPVAPVMYSPLDADTPVGTPSFVWIACTGANAYQFQYSSDSSFSSVDYSTPGDTVPGTSLVVTTHKPTVNMTVGIPYYWHARARDAAGNWGAWTTARSIITQASLPGVPVVTAPVSGIFTNSAMPSFIWNVVSGAATYDIQIDNLATFASPEVTGNVATNSFTPSSAITPDALYYYRIRAVNATGGVGAWATIRSFTLDTAAPAAPLLSSPLDATTPIGTPTFIWGASTGATAYQFQYSMDNTFSAVDYSTPGDTVPGTPLAVTSHKPTVNMTLGIPYYWRARSRDAAGNWSLWSASRSVNVQASLPAVPLQTAPALGQVTNNTTPDFTWNAVTGAVSYDVQVDNLSTFASPEVSDSTATNLFTPSTPISPDGLYYWRARALNITGGAGAWSGARTMTIDTVAPPAPALATPLDNTTPVGTPTFIWGASAGATAYQFQYSADNSFSSINYSTPGDTYSGTPLTVLYHKPTVNMTAGTPYSWRVRARDAGGNWGDWSAIRTIIVQVSLPALPVLIAPASGQVTNNTTPDFKWNAVAGAVSYDVQVDNLSTFANPEVSGSTSTTTFTPSTPITPDGLYYWRARSVNATGGAGAWSAAPALTIDTVAPPAPALSTPLDNTTPVGTPTFIWVAPTGGTAYQFQYSADSGFSTIDYSTPGDTYPGTPMAVTYHKPTVNMTAGTPYYWRARARDLAGNWGTWSAVRSIIVQTSLPGIPVVIAPTVGWVTNNVTPTFDWNPVTDALYYDIQIDNQSTFLSPEVISDSPTDSFTPSSPITPDGVYYYRIRAVNATGGAGAWSAARGFVLDTVAPALPVLSSPLTGSTAVGNPTFLWGAVVSANAYDIQLAKTEDFASPVSMVPVMPIAAVTYTPTSGLNPLTKYYWHVRARDVAGNWGGWSATRSVSIIPPVPTAPTLVSPASAGYTNDTKPVLTWNPVTFADSYRIQISLVSTFATTIINSTTFDQTYQPGESLGSDGLYYWRVQSVNAIGQVSAWSAVRTYTLDTVAPAAPVLTAPVEATILPTGIPTFSWAAVVGASAYQFQMDDFFGHVFSTPGGPLAEFVAGTPLAVTSYKPTSMTPGITYYWHVRARDAAGNWSVWSAYRRVIEQAPLPAAPVLESPTDKIYTSLHYSEFTWLSAANAVRYEIQVDKFANFVSLDKVDTTLGLGVLNYTSSVYKSGDQYWRVRGINVNGMPGPWSAVRKLTIEFDSSFNSDSDGWDYSTSQWVLSGGALVAPGDAEEGISSVAIFDGIYSDFTYEVSMKMDLATTALTGWEMGGYGVFVHTSSSSTSNGYYFQIASIEGYPVGEYRLFKVVNGSRVLIKNWTFSNSMPYNPGGFNTIKTISNGAILAFYVNNSKVIQISNPGPLSGKVGVLSFWWWDQQSTYVDWARISYPTSTASMGIQAAPMEAPAVVHFKTNDAVPPPID